MKEFRVKVHTDGKKELVEEGEDGRFLVTVRAPRKEGRANERLRTLLAKHFLVDVEQVQIIRGKDQSSKTVRLYVESLPRIPKQKKG
jgi:uncharacterized protein YggU (UPF0235/DUF167 family)